MPRTPSHPKRSATQALAAWLLVTLAVAPPYLPAARAEVEGEHVVKGNASFHRDGDLTVIRPSDNAIIDYTRFDILRQETVRFEQQSSQSRVLNRVYGDARIDGVLEANGIVYIVNPSGVFIGGEAVVDVGRLVAAAGDMSNRDFLRGVDAFTLTGALVNEGEIRADSVTLLGRRVANHGSIVAPDGVIALVAGERVLLTQLDGGISVVVDGPEAADAGGYGIEQTGLVDAGPKGRALFAVGDHYSLALNHTGLTRAREIEARGGDDGLVRVAGTLDASSARGKGGRVRVVGDRILLDGATIDASGAWGGGQIRIGGDVRGTGALRHARRTFVSSDTLLRVDALARGDGGSVVVYADESAGFFGRISARGGAAGGDGGFAELSSGGALVDEGTFDLRAPMGAAGTLLYDPQDILIVGGPGDLDDNGNDGDVVTGDSGTAGSILFGDAGNGDTPFEISEGEIEGTDANIVLEARNSIRATGTFSHDQGEGTGVLAIGSGNDLTLRTRNEAGDETGSPSPAPGIDLTSSDHGADLEVRSAGDGRIVLETGTGTADGVEADIHVGRLRTEGGDAVMTTEDGSITANTVVTTGVGTTDGDGVGGGDIRMDAGDQDGSGETTISVTGDLIARGSDGTTGRGGAGGAVGLRTRAKPLPPPQVPPVPNPPASGGGPISVAGEIDTSAGSGIAGGGVGGQVFVEANAQGDISLGDVTAQGGNGSDPDAVSSGGRGGAVQLFADDGDIQVGAIDTTGGTTDGSQFDEPADPMDPKIPLERGGAGGSVTITAGRGSPASGPIDDPNGGILLAGNITALGGDNPNPDVENGDGAGGRVELRAKDDIEHAGQAGPQITTQGAVIFNGANVGAAGAFVVDGGDTEAGLLGVGAKETARVDATGGFDDLQIASLTGDADIEVTQGSSDVVDVNAGRIEAIDTTESGADVVVALNDELTDGDDLDLTLVVETGSTDAGGTLRLVSEDDIQIGDGGGTAITMHAQPEDPDDPDAPITSGFLILVADSDNNGEGAITDGGGRLDLVGDADEAGGLLASSAAGIGTEAEPILITGGGKVALETQESGGIFVRNEDSGDLTVAQIFTPVGSLDGVRVLAGTGHIGLENAAPSSDIDGHVVIERSVRTPVVDDMPGGDVRLAASPGASVVLAAPTNVTAVDAGGNVHFASDVTLMEDSTVLSLGDGDITFDGAIDTDAERLDRVRTLAVVTEGVTTLTGDVGATSDLRELLIAGKVALEGDRQISTTNGVALGGDIDGVGGDDSASLTIRTARVAVLDGNVGTAAGGRLSSFTIDYNDDSPFGTDLAPVDVLFSGSADQTVLTGAGGIAINPDGRPEVPDAATIAKLGGGLTLDSEGGTVALGPNEKLTVQGVANLNGSSVRIGDVSAIELHVDSPDTVIDARPAADVLLKSGGRARDGGTDLIANVVSFTTAPTFAGAGPAPRIAASTTSGTGTLEVRGLSNGIDAGRLLSGDGDVPLDLAILPADPGHETVLRGPVVGGLVPPRTSDEPATGSALPPSAEETLAFLRCAADRPGDCPAATPGSPLDTPRGRDLALRAQRWLGSTDDAHAARRGVVGLDAGALRELAVFLTEVRLLGLSDTEYAAVRDAFYAELLSDAGPGAPAPEVLAQGVQGQSRGVPL